MESWIGRADEIARALAVDEVRLVPVRAGASREAYRVESPAGEGIAFLRADPPTGTGVMAGTHLTLDREATVLIRLHELGFPVPAVLATFRDPAGTVLDLVPGTSSPDAETVERVAPDYLATLARLHAADPHEFDLPRYASTTEAIEADLRWWTDRAVTTGVDRQPVIRLALRVLAERVPDDPSPPAPVHGDAGPGNFMVHENRVSGLLDWELFHVGDPHEDLAWIWMRGAHTEFGDFATRLSEYERFAPRPVDRSRLDWHTAFVIAKSVISLWIGVTTTPSGGDALLSVIPQLAYDALLGSALVRLQGGSLRLLETPATPSESAVTRLVDQLATTLGETSRRTSVVVDHLRRHAELENWRSSALAAGLRDLAGADKTGNGPIDLIELVDTAGSTQLPALTRLVAAAADRELRSQPYSERLVQRAQRNGLGI
ncbi:phosphotransferase family protein [Cryptosporangium aurantiacum]|uniref:Predicted kinase, aminoglycoside phosphotransferase (APT) family n=1 Tax=Cryptosporangium aurantiacum TaxID=134849 RepID=A0A1M7PFH5_9ACTN|nr:phosphotransferase family protein [Cryptosporangium aurantiacum]SHN15765.1 Predicted kinase, aminoglycoside phosphotransferase (APT) family [Cryptosporangium aurantiacum]